MSMGIELIDRPGIWQHGDFGCSERGRGRLSFLRPCLARAGPGPTARLPMIKGDYRSDHQLQR